MSASDEFLLKAFREQAENIRKSESIRAEILKGLSRGGNMVSLFLKAAECISLMTGDAVFYKQVNDTLRTKEGRTAIE